MDDYITVKISKDELLDMLIKRVCFWETGREHKDLYEKMYDSYIFYEVFDNAVLDIMGIVDNDIINYTTILEEGDEDFLKVLELAEQDEYDISCETCYSFIEAVSDDKKRILVRW